MPLSAGSRRPLQQVCRFKVHGPRQSVDDVDACRVETPLEGADVGTVDPGAVGEFLLRQARCPSISSQVQRQHLAYLHGHEGTVLWSISPRSIFYNRLSGTSAEGIGRVGRTPWEFKWGI